METERERRDREEDAEANGKAGERADGDLGADESVAGAGEAAGSADEQAAALAAERDELKDRLLRLAAEFDNWKKRARKEQADAETKAREAVLKDMLEVIDNLDRAVSAYGEGGNGSVDGPAVLKGVGLVLRLFQSKLERYGVSPIEAAGKPFDPHQHQAISRVETADVPPGTVAAELQRGYRIGDRLLRPSLVTVAAAPPSSSPPPSGQGPDGVEGGSA